MAFNVTMSSYFRRSGSGLIALFLFGSVVLFCPVMGHAQQTGAFTAMSPQTLPDAPTPARAAGQVEVFLPEAAFDPRASSSQYLSAQAVPSAPPSAPRSNDASANGQASGTGASAAGQPTCDDSGEGQQTKRILGVLPNFRSVSVNTILPPQSPKEKFIGFSQESFDYSSFILVGLLASVDQIQGSTPEFHKGPPAFGRYYWHNFADQTDENLFVDFLLPVAFHEDARYYTLGRRSSCKHHGFFIRTGYALSRVLVTRTDAGGERFNFSEIVGSGASSGLSNLYYPPSDRGWNQTGQRWLLNIGIDGISFVAREFWPDINHILFRN
jgi:hypothetical protein